MRERSGWWAPGRVNLIGEHTDYNGGLSMPFAIDLGTTVSVTARTDDRITVTSASHPGTVDAAIGELGGPGWWRHVTGVAWALGEAGVDLRGADVHVEADVPAGAGLSSSASLQVAAALALCGLAGVEPPAGLVVEVCHRCETEAVGAPVGLLDHLAVVHAAPGAATLIDFSDLEVRHVPFADPVCVIDTGVRHDNAAGGYAARRRECEEAALALGVATLASASVDEVEARLEGVLRRRARHVVGECGRVRHAAAALAAGGPVGPLLDASHESLRHDFEVSCEELDVAVDAARAAGAAGARLTGAGFGGCALALGAPAGALAEVVGAQFARRGWAPPRVWAVAPGGGPRPAMLCD